MIDLHHRLYCDLIVEFFEVLATKEFLVERTVY